MDKTQFLKKNAITLIIIGLTIVNIYIIINYLFFSSGMLLYLLLFGIPCIGLGIYKRLEPQLSEGRSIEASKDALLEQKLLKNCIKCGSTEDLVIYTHTRVIPVGSTRISKSIRIEKTVAQTWKGNTCPKCKKSFDKWGRIKAIIFFMFIIPTAFVLPISLAIFLFEKSTGGTPDPGYFIAIVISIIFTITTTILYIIHYHSENNPRHYFIGDKAYKP
ncbi:hypothetical protein ES705_38876 [subsurface metagenome]